MADGLGLLDKRLVVLHPAVAYAVSSPAACPSSLRWRQIIKIGRFGLHGLGIEGLTLKTMGVASLVEKEPRQCQVPSLTGGAVEFDQGQLDLFVPTDIMTFSRSKNAVNMIGESLRCVNRLLFPAVPMMLDCHLEKVAGIVQLVLQAQGFPPLVGVMDDVVRNQETVLLLSGQDAIENAFHALAQLAIVAML
jgi:hypothetical protein